MGGCEAGALASVEPTLKYHPGWISVLTATRYPGAGQCQAGSLTGAVASQKVTEASKGSLSLVGNQVQSIRVYRELNCEIDGSSRWETRA